MDGKGPLQPLPRRLSAIDKIELERMPRISAPPSRCPPGQDCFPVCEGTLSSCSSAQQSGLCCATRRKQGTMCWVCKRMFAEGRKASLQRNKPQTQTGNKRSFQFPWTTAMLMLIFHPSSLPPRSAPQLSFLPWSQEPFFPPKKGDVSQCRGVQGTYCLRQQQSGEGGCFSHELLPHLQFAVRAKHKSSFGVRFLKTGAGHREQPGCGISWAGHCSDQKVRSAPKKSEIIYFLVPKSLQSWAN